MEIHYGRDLTIDQFREILDLDKKIHPEKVIYDQKDAEKGFLKNPESIIALYNEGRLAACICFAVVDKEVYEKVHKNCQVINKNIPLELARPFSKDRDNYIFVRELINDIPYRKKEIEAIMVGEMGKLLAHKQKAGFPIKKIFGYTVSEDKKTMAKIFKQTALWEKPGFQIFECSPEELFGYEEDKEKEDGLKIHACKLSKKQMSEVTDVIKKAFEDTKTFQKIFESNLEISEYIKLLVDYYNKNGEIHTAVYQGKIVGAAIWNLPGKTVASIVDLIAGRTDHPFSDDTLMRLSHEFLITERHHYRPRHYYLYFIGSIHKGAGSELLGFAMRRFKPGRMYLENSDMDANKDFYKNFGFKRLKVIKVFGIPVELLMYSQDEEEKL